MVSRVRGSEGGAHARAGRAMERGWMRLFGQLLHSSRALPSRGASLRPPPSASCGEAMPSEDLPASLPPSPGD